MLRIETLETLMQTYHDGFCIVYFLISLNIISNYFNFPSSRFEDHCLVEFNYGI